jgi:hypothetical protein
MMPAVAGGPTRYGHQHTKVEVNARWSACSEELVADGRVRGRSPRRPSPRQQFVTRA